jgi:hypothetical protein
MKYIVSAKRYWFPVICRSFVNPSNFALPTGEYQHSSFLRDIGGSKAYYCFDPRTTTNKAASREEEASNPTSTTKPSH